MKKIIGGLLVVSLLSSPSILKVDYLAYEVFKTQKQIIYVIRKEMEDLEKETTVASIDKIMGDIDNKTRSITSLLKEKNKLMDKIQTNLDLRACTKAPLDDGQINAFTDFTAMYNSEGGVLQETLRKINEKHLNDTKKEILHNNTDYEVVINELTAIHDYQCEAIYSLNKIIEMGEKTLQAL